MAGPGERRPGSAGGRESGFTFVELIVAIMIVTIVAGAGTTFFISSLAAVRVQDAEQTAAHLAGDAIDWVRRLSPAALVVGRDQQTVDAQWAQPAAGVDLSAAQIQKVYDASAASGAGASAALKTVGDPVTMSGVAFTRYWYVGKCWQANGGSTCTTGAAYAPFYRVIVAVTWTDNACPANTCDYVTATLVSSKFLDPVF